MNTKLLDKFILMNDIFAESVDKQSALVRRSKSISINSHVKQKRSFR